MCDNIRDLVELQFDRDGEEWKNFSLKTYIADNDEIYCLQEDDIHIRNCQ